MLSAWAAIHSSDPTVGPEGHIARRVGNVLRQIGGDGTPGVQDFSARSRWPVELTDPEPPIPSRALAFPADLLDALREIDVTRRRPEECCTCTCTRAPCTVGTA